MTLPLGLMILGVLCLSGAVWVVWLDVRRDVDRTKLLILVLSLSALGFSAIAIVIQTTIR